MKTAIRKTVSLLLIFLLALTFLPARPAQAAEENASIPSDLLLAALDATSRPPAAGIQTGGLNFTFEAGGLQAAGFNWGVSLSGFGRGNQVSELSAAETVQTERQTEYRRPELTEWRRATAFGLQQGFTIQSAPSGKGALTLRLSLSTDLTGTLDADKRGLSFPIEDGRTLRYDHLLAWDANGAALDAQLVYMPGEIRIVVRDAGAAYPLTIDPLIYLEQKVIASDGAVSDDFGYSVALNAAGDTAIVGAYLDDVGANTNQGSAYVFTRNGGVWSQQAQLTASDGATYDYFGVSVALNAAGDTAIVGAYGDDVGANADQGSAYVFTRNGGVWSQQAQLTASDGAANDYFGRSVALNARGDTAIVGADYDNVGANFDQGSAYVFARSGGVWSQQAQLTASDGAAGDYFGYSVALNAAGDAAIVGAYRDDVGANADQGSAYVFTRNGGVWSQQAQLTASDGAAGDYFGHSAALNAAGDTAIVGADYDNVGANADQGSAYVFARSGGVWSQQAQLTASDGAAGDYFGRSVALNAAGDTAIVGADWDDVGANTKSGSAYVFTRNGGVWSQQAQLTASDGAAYDNFGASVALNAAGDTAIVGAHLDNVGANTDQGSAYFYQAYRTDNDLAVSATRGSSAPLHANDAVLLTASVMNYGPAAASSVGLNVPLPAGLTYASHTATRGSYDPVSGSWNVGNLPAYVSATLTIAVTVSNPAPKVTIYFTSSLVGRDTNDANNSSKLALPPAKTVIYRSNGAQDGWILESGENTNKGGTLDANATTFRLGDDAARKQYRAILSFNTSGLPDNAVITKVTLKVKRQGVTGGGNPVNTFQGFLADVKKGAFGTSALQITDYQTAANKTVGPDGPTPISEWYTLDLTGAGNFVNKLASNGGLTQIRLRFSLDDNNNAAANYLSLFSGNAPLASRPQLIVEYYIP
ncbi:MAG: DNRLRE domain-containing protein [Anaerolineales bacterium]|nr:DNRLRE domain-containing protein [Anaerolineales bacterium]